MAINYKDTVALIEAVERMNPPASFLLDTFFPRIPNTSVTAVIEVQYRKGARRLAPFVTRGTKGINMKRDTVESQFYKAPMMGPRRVLDPDVINERGFGEGIYSSKTPEERAADAQAYDLTDLQNMIINRKNKMAADILTTGKCEIKGFADDGKTELLDTIDYGFDQKLTPSKTWDQAGATIYADIKNMSEEIQQNAGIVPTVMVIAKNVFNYMLGNDEIMKWLAVPSRDNLGMFSFSPKIVSPQVTRVGIIQALNMEVYTYGETYLDDDENPKPFIGENDAIIAIPGRGRQLHGAVTLVNEAETGYNTYAVSYVPYYDGNKESQTVALSMYSRCVLAPESVNDWAVIKAKG